MKEILQTATPIALLGLIACVVGAAVAYWIASRMGANRETLRKLRGSLERDPSPGQLAEARRMWPIVNDSPPKLQLGEMIRHAHSDEAKISQRFEAGKALSRVCIGFGVVFGIIYLVGTFWKPA